MHVQKPKSHASIICGANRRSKNVLHEWVIYRQNLTSSIAATFLQPAITDHQREDNVPYGDFRMNGQAIEGIIRAARADNTKLSKKANIYLKFGLPRITILDNNRVLKQFDLMTVGREHKFTESMNSNWDSKINNNHEQHDDNHIKEVDIDCKSITSSENSQKNAPQIHYASSKIMPDMNALRRLPQITIINLCVWMDERTLLEKWLSKHPRISYFLRDISFTLKGGETLAVLYTNATEMHALLEVLSNCTLQKYVVSGQLENNGVELSMDEFGERVAYVNSSDIYPWLTVLQTLRLASSFTAPVAETFESTKMIEQLVQTLALSSYRNLLCGELGGAEKERLKIAIQILKNTDILLTDNVIKDMNVYDMAFIINYIRDWAINLNRIAIVAVQPPTFEIFTMFHKALLIASGKVIYFGPCNQMIGYFENIGFPCPSFQNPCEYYVDLVTYDYLTPEASIESIKRIDQLTNAWIRTNANVKLSQMKTTIPELSPKVYRISQYRAALLIYRRFFSMWLSRPWYYVKEPIYGFITSLVIGFVFYDIPNDRRAAINARFGFIISTLTVFLLPSLFLHIERVHDERTYLFDDIQNRLYDPTLYAFIKIMYDFPIATLWYALYALVAYMLSGLPPNGTFYWPSVFSFTIITCLHALLWHYISWIVAYCCSTQKAAITIIVILLSVAIIFSGFLIHPNRFKTLIKLLHFCNPTKLAGQQLAENEFLHRTTFSNWLFEIFSTNTNNTSNNITELLIGCERKQVETKFKIIHPISITSHCSKIRGSQALYFSGISPSTASSSGEEFHKAIQIYAIWFMIILGMLLLVIRCNHRPSTKPHRKLLYD